jgi:prophage regulatory protein
MTVKLLSPSDLESKKGIRFSRQHRHRLVAEGKFPAPVKLGEATNAWVESKIDAWLEAKIAERDARLKFTANRRLVEPALARRTGCPSCP